MSPAQVPLEAVSQVTRQQGAWTALWDLAGPCAVDEGSLESLEPRLPARDATADQEECGSHSGLTNARGREGPGRQRPAKGQGVSHEAGPQPKQADHPQKASHRLQSSPEGNRKCPTSILRGSHTERPGCRAEPLRTSKRVRFQEPVEVAVHYIAGRESTPATKVPHRPRPCARPLLLGLSLCLLLALLLSLCCGRPGPAALALEDLRARLLALALRLRHAALACWHCLWPL